MKNSKILSPFLMSLIFLVLCPGIKLSGSDKNDKVSENIFDLIYNQKFTEAEAELIRSKDILEKWNYQILVLDLKWWKAISSNNETDFAEFESILEEYSHDLNNAYVTDNLEELIYLSYSLRFALLKSRIFSALVNIYKINQIIVQFEINKLPVEQQEIFQIYAVLFNIGKSKLLFYNSNIYIEGIKVLENYLTSGNPVCQTISYYFLSKIYFDMDRSSLKARIYCEKLCERYPGNKLFANNLNLCKTIEF